MLPESSDFPHQKPFKVPRLAVLSETEMLARVLHRDASVLIVNKPAGIAVHVGANADVSIEQSFHHLQFGLPRPPALAHRLDRDTSGCLVLGRHKQALIELGKLFAANKVEKTYHAIVVGTPAQAEGVIARPILKTGQGSRWRIVLDEAGQEAITHYKVLVQGEGVSLMEFSPKTGRTHQIRVHSALALGCPVVGDTHYGVAEGVFSSKEASLMLHATQVRVPLNPKKDAIAATAPLPEHFINLADSCGVAWREWAPLS